jgi:carbonic anhydrase
MSSDHHAGPGITAVQALRRLIDGNRRFLSGKPRFLTIQKQVLAALAKAQQPYATILGCSDSRVPPELLFDASFGELFVIRVAGNTLSPEVAGSLQYAGVHLRTPLFVVLGHEGCGAVSAALETHFHSAQHRSRIARLLKNITPALADLNPNSPPRRLLAQAIEANVRHTMAQVLRSPEGKARAAEGQMKLVGAIYQIKTGRVKFLP